MLEAGVNRDERAGEKGCVPEVPAVQFIPTITRANNATTRFAERTSQLWEDYKDAVRYAVNDEAASEEHGQVEIKYLESLQAHAIFIQDEKLSSTYKALEAYKLPIVKAVAEKKHLTLFSLHYLLCLTFLTPNEILEKVNEYPLPTKEEVLAKYPLKPEEERGTFVS